jgi:hypothetical protein
MVEVVVLGSNTNGIRWIDPEPEEVINYLVSMEGTQGICLFLRLTSGEVVVVSTGGSRFMLRVTTIVDARFQTVVLRDQLLSVEDKKLKFLHSNGEEDIVLLSDTVGLEFATKIVEQILLNKALPEVL